MAKEMMLLVDGAAGIYVPQRFFKQYKTHIQGCEPEDLEILNEGPDHEHYWEAWESVLNNGRVISIHGETFTLYQDGDLWAVPPGYEWKD